jgi:hypothetical protein
MSDPGISEPNNIVPINANVQLPAELLDHAAADAGKGVSMKSEDQILPMVRVLQSNSPAVDQRGDEYVTGAAPGDFLLKGSTKPIRDGVAGIEVVPVDMAHVWNEWLPARGGFAGSHDHQPDDAKLTLVSEGGRDKQLLIRPSGHVIEESRLLFLLVEGQPYVLSCASTKHTFAKTWNTYMSQFRHPKTGGVLPAFSRKYRLVTVPQANSLGRWFGLRFHDQGWVSLEEYDAARAFHEVVKQGRARVEAPREPGDAA